MRPIMGVLSVRCVKAHITRIGFYFIVIVWFYACFIFTPIYSSLIHPKAYRMHLITIVSPSHSLIFLKICSFMISSRKMQSFVSSQFLLFKKEKKLIPQVWIGCFFTLFEVLAFKMAFSRIFLSSFQTLRELFGKVLNIRF